ncbi:hypothetical protein FOXYS1_13543 [Fusarium oxysporum]|uniref:Xylanolytic transcriptional activator regulatory domain-containing protein n=1 Tax=Fusarium oxysporum TaxID=5507 RepID=A0A8H5A1Z4_FUSOX|nr:hypothetical protein FOXYS1_13543 [Fusarium oxysporum]
MLCRRHLARSAQLSPQPTSNLDDNERRLAVNEVDTSAATTPPSRPHETTLVELRSSSCPPIGQGFGQKTLSSVTTNPCTFMRNEISSQLNLFPDRGWVLESALSLVNKFSKAVQHDAYASDELPDDWDMTSCDEVPSELIFTILRVMLSAHAQRTDRSTLGEHAGANTATSYHWPDHISTPLLEQMCMAQIGNEARGQAVIQNKVCIFAKATVYFNRWSRCARTAPFTDALRKARQRYAIAGLGHLKQLNFVSSPTLGTVQALLSGVTLALSVGNTSQAWNLTAFASRLIVSFGYHSISEDVLSRPEWTDVRLSVCWCYYMDKTLSMLLLRPSSLPSLSSDPIALVCVDPEDPLTLKYKIMIRLARVQDASLPHLIGPSNPDPLARSAAVDSLKVELEDIYTSIASLHTEWAISPDYKVEWDTTNFTYHSIFTMVLRLDLESLHDRVRRDECLMHARQALSSMRDLQSQIDYNAKSSTDLLIWSVLLYPLTPFFVLFCNVMATSDPQDLELLRQVTAVISGVQEYYKFGKNLYKLFSQFLSLCLQSSNEQDCGRYHCNNYGIGRLTVQEPEANYSQPCQFASPPTSLGLSVPEARNPSLSATAKVAQLSEQDTYCADQHGSGAGMPAGPEWDDKLIWEIFAAQLSNDRLNLDTDIMWQT